MFDNLSESLEKTFKNLRGYGKISEKNVKDALREVRMSLLEADVHVDVAKQFIANVREKCLGEEVLLAVKPGEQIVKRIHEELVATLGGERSDFFLNARPAMTMLLGLHGAGKTTTCGKLALRWKKEDKKVLLVGCDIRRPAAVDQLAVLADQSGVDMLRPEPGETVPQIGRRAREHAVRNSYDIVIFDTGGRFQIDEELVDELAELKKMVEPHNIVLVLDAAIGQESVNVASRFNEAVGLTGLILTKLDGDARGGAALSVQSVTKVPIHLIGVGEKAEDLEVFHPDRLASRILGMGDVVTLVEKAQENFDEKEMAGMQKRLMRNQLNLEDFLVQLQQMKKLGSMDKMFEMLPGASKIPKDERAKIAEQSQTQSKKFEAIIQSMTIEERRKPHMLKASRRQRIARGSGNKVSDVNALLKQFKQAQKMTKKLKKVQKKLLRFSN